ncbi:major histocompatibility complex class I-related gene protein-like [Danio aesculapii]|uniref:major histocompatibility complex class I-related gene protein-like n=1 Tax=Danio aesculapii TaxID=1142201 RepID=UPI0024BFC258|nr:major histocompatibility complex class I-related gene protein-like [Danio aesculapii]
MIMDVKVLTLLSVFLLYGTLPSCRAEKHSLYYIYTVLSRPVDLPGIYTFSAMGLVDDRQIDSYNSKDQRKIPKQQWMKEKMQEDYWEKGTQSRKNKEQWFSVNVNILMDRMRHNASDGKCKNCLPNLNWICVVAGAVLMLGVVALLLRVFLKKKTIGE